MSRDARFWRNVTIIALLHVVLLVALVRWSREAKTPANKNIVWLDGGAGAGAEGFATPQPSSSSSPSSATQKQTTAPTAKETPEPTSTAEVEDEQPVLTAAKSDIRLPTATPKTRSTPKPKATPKPSVTPRPTPKPSPKATPKKKIVAKVPPKPTATPAKRKKEKENEEETAAVKKKKEIAKLALAKKNKESPSEGQSPAKPAKKTAAAHGTKKGSAGNGGEGSGSGGASEFGWYGNMLHDRFYSEWMQPTTVVASGATISALVKIRIEKDGTVSEFKLIRPSGNVVVDESIEAVAKRVTQVDPLPAGLGSGDHYDVNINFEVNPNE